jgi:hypothetical protein
LVCTSLAGSDALMPPERQAVSSGARAGGAGVNGGRSEPPHLGQHARRRVVGEVVRLGEAEQRGHRGVDLGAQGVIDPAEAKLAG